MLMLRQGVSGLLNAFFDLRVFYIQMHLHTIQLLFCLFIVNMSSLRSVNRMNVCVCENEHRVFTRLVFSSGSETTVFFTSGWLSL